MLIAFVKEKPFLGYGYGEAFWMVTDNLRKIWAVFSWHPAYAHNAYLEIILDMGMIGFVVWVLFLIYVLRSSLYYFLREHTLPALIFFAWSVAITIYNLSDNLLGSYETFYWFLLVVAFSFSIRDIIERKRPVSAGPS
jgi:O-antigen ligase